MKFFGWVQNKLNGKAIQQTNAVPTSHHLVNQGTSNKEEFSDWPQSLLTIGTFGTNDLKDNPPSEIETHEEENPSSSPDLSEFTPEEVGHLQKELIKLLKRKPAKQEDQNSDLPLDRFLNCPSSLEVSRRLSNAACIDPDYKEDDIERTISVIIGKCKEVWAEKSKKDIGKKSLTFLLKKMFVCSSGFTPAPSLRDPLPESRMEKLLRTILKKKIYPQHPSRATSMKRYIEGKNAQKKKDEDEEEQEPQRPRASDGSKWVKTDSEFIVLEI